MVAAPHSTTVAPPAVCVSLHGEAYTTGIFYSLTKYGRFNLSFEAYKMQWPDVQGASQPTARLWDLNPYYGMEDEIILC